MDASLVLAVPSSSPSCVHFRFIYQNHARIYLLRHARTRTVQHYV